MEKLRDNIQVTHQRVFLAAAITYRSKSDNLAELTALAESAGGIVVGRQLQKINRIHPATYIGKGKANLISAKAKANLAEVVIFDNDLSPAQIRQLEEIIGIKVLDRSELILDIFASRARTKQAKLQVELAQLEYTYPRLTRMWSHLDTVTGAAGAAGAGAVGGIGTRGTGEKQLEIDRRLVGKRITELKRSLAEIDRRRIRQIDARRDMFKICLVGYTNAGKSTLMNKLTSAEVYVQDRLFATLDTRTRQWALDGNKKVLLSDTVGFVRDLPHQLVASFKATLEEAVNADLLIHVVDVSNSAAEVQAQQAVAVLNEIGCKDNPMLTVLNKADNVSKQSQLDLLCALYPEAICISAKTGMNIDLLTEKIVGIYTAGQVMVRISAAASNGKLQSFIESNCEVLARRFELDRAVFDVRIGRKQLYLLKKQRSAEIIEDF